MADIVRHWNSPAWFAEASTWILATCARLGLRVVAPVAHHRVRFWSVLLTVETAEGRVWFKENNPGQRFEAALTMELVGIAPGQILPPLAVDRDHGWILTADAGPVLRERGPLTEPVLLDLVHTCANVQRRAAEHGTRLRAAGLPARPSGDAVGYVRRQVEWLARLDATHPLHLDAAAASELLAGLPRLDDAVAQVAALGLPDSVEHNDLHTGNVFVAPDGRLLLFDWGDAVWANPVGSLLAPHRILTVHGDLGGDPPLARTVDAYLEHWSDLAPMGELRAAVPAALRVAGAQRFETFRRLMDAMDPEHLVGWRDPILSWLRSTVA
ncbi:phosphotransferase [Propioniciclava soli]|uniref:phosphotransferase n=1 Tax=Propioniciclava soli TaxID=2775081 RepID=UPI001E3C8469